MIMWNVTAAVSARRVGAEAKSCLPRAKAVIRPVPTAGLTVITIGVKER